MSFFQHTVMDSHLSSSGEIGQVGVHLCEEAEKIKTHLAIFKLILCLLCFEKAVIVPLYWSLYTERRKDFRVM